MNPIYDGVIRSADISACGTYRWSLCRHWPKEERDGNKRTVCFIGLNPSTADGICDDATLRRCMTFARAWGYSMLVMRNLFALRSRKPSALLKHPDPVGGAQGDEALADAALADLVVVAWGGRVPFGRDRDALRLLGGKKLHCLKLTSTGAPWHALYTPGNLQPMEFPCG